MNEWMGELTAVVGLKKKKLGDWGRLYTVPNLIKEVVWECIRWWSEIFGRAGVVAVSPNIYKEELVDMKISEDFRNQ